MVPIRHDVTPRTSAAESVARRYVLSVDLPFDSEPDADARVDELLTRAVRDLAAAAPGLRPRLELIPSGGGAATGSRPEPHVPRPQSPARGRSRLPLLEIDLDARRVFVGDELARLAFKEFEILRLLLEHPGSVVSREEIAACIGQGSERPAPRTIDVHVHRIRAKLAETGDVISTVRGLGYRFNPSSAVVVD